MENSEDFKIIEDLRQSNEYGKYMESIGWKTVKIGDQQIFLRKIGFLGIIKIQRIRNNINIAILNKLIKKERVFMCKIEPDEYFPLDDRFTKTFKVSKWPLLGTKTLRVDLRSTESELFNSFKKDCRYEIRKLNNHNLEIVRNDFDNFYDIWRQSSKRKKLWIPSKSEFSNLLKCFNDQVFCITVKNQSGALVLVHKKTAFYYYAGSTIEGNKLNLPYLTVWECMKEAQKSGCKYWDFEGIYDHRWPNKGWEGFSHFKKSFGGKEVNFPGSYEKWYWPL